ncbi:hypothetical protein BJY18_005978 [Amycolatopsis jiangsuensis]|uniref:Uncharacterized protein n=1 Tax=Amycolatopsis jiangsuensis TaxID=1181879 RepID=A0A840J3Q0_9PSEU|nr:hypothetical protein [Amycolatopsis jiangsuensis]
MSGSCWHCRRQHPAATQERDSSLGRVVSIVLPRHRTPPVEWCPDQTPDQRSYRQYGSTSRLAVLR